MEREHLIIVAILALVLYMLMKHSSDCDCSRCINDRTVGMPAHIRMGRFEENLLPPPGTNPFSPSHIRHSDKYIGAGQHIKNHIRYDSRQGMFNGMFSGSSQRIRYDECGTNGMPC